MQIKTIAMMAVAGCAIGMLTGCGVKQEVHDEMIASMKADREASEAALNLTIGEKDSLLKAEQARTQKLTGELKEAEGLIAELKKNAADLKSSVAEEQGKISSLESKLASANAATAAAKSQVVDAQNESSAMEMEKQEVQRRFDALVENLLRLNKIKPSDLNIENIDMSDVEDAGVGSAIEQPQPSSPSGSQSVKSLLDDMGDL